jgi:hypothetical protein
MDSTPSRPQANKDQSSAAVKALEEALSRLVGEDTASASERRAQMAGSDAVWADEPLLHATFRLAIPLKDHSFLGETPSPGGRFSRAPTRFLVGAFIGVGCILAWRPGEGLTPQDLSAKTSRCTAQKPSAEISAASHATDERSEMHDDWLTSNADCETT